MTAHQLGGFAWRKSSYSTDNGNCVEVGWSEPTEVAVRDSKQEDSPALAFDDVNWRAFLSRLAS
jgi:hypothetical protein